MSLPKFVREILERKYSSDNVDVIEKYWNLYADQYFSFINSTEREIVNEGTIVYECIKAELLA